jgi:hypothetical protein
MAALCRDAATPQRTRSLSTVQAGRGRRSRVRLSRAVRFPAGANVAQAFGHDAAGGGRNINANPLAFQITSCVYI